MAFALQQSSSYVQGRKEIEPSLDLHPQIIVADSVHQGTLKLGIKIWRQVFSCFKVSPHDISNCKKKHKIFIVEKTETLIYLEIQVSIPCHKTASYVFLECFT